jgi:hypothetical protein
MNTVELDINFNTDRVIWIRDLWSGECGLVLSRAPFFFLEGSKGDVANERLQVSKDCGTVQSHTSFFLSLMKYSGSPIFFFFWFSKKKKTKTALRLAS